MDAETRYGHTTREVSRRYRVGEDKVRAWIRQGELKAINTATAMCGKPRWVITAEALTEFEKRRSSEPPTKPERRRSKPTTHDYFPDGATKAVPRPSDKK